MLANIRRVVEGCQRGSGAVFVRVRVYLRVCDHRFPLGSEADPAYNLIGTSILDRVLIGAFSYWPFKEVPMFDSLADRIRQDEHKEVNTTERVIRWVVIAVVSIVVFGGLYYGVRMLD